MITLVEARALGIPLVEDQKENGYFVGTVYFDGLLFINVSNSQTGYLCEMGYVGGQYGTIKLPELTTSDMKVLYRILGRPSHLTNLTPSHPDFAQKEE